MATALSKLFTDLAKLHQGSYEPLHGLENGDASLDAMDAILDQIAAAPVTRSRSRLSTPDELWSVPRVGLILNDVVVLSGGNAKVGGSFSVAAGFLMQLQKKWDDPSTRPVFPAHFMFRQEELLRWLDDARTLIEDGRLVYLPERAFVTPTVDGDGIQPLFLADDTPWRIVVDVLHGRRSDSQTLVPASAYVDQAAYHDIFQVAVPFVDKLPLQLLAKVMQDEEDAVIRFRRALASAVAQYTETTPGDAAPADLRTAGLRIKHEVIEPELAMLNQRFQRITQVRSIRMAGAAVGTIGLCATAILGATMEATITAALGAGGAGLLARELAEMRAEVLALKESPWYFAWRLKRTS